MFKSLILNDIKYIKKDFMMIVILILPFMMIFIYQILVNVVPDIFGADVGNYIEQYKKDLQYVFITISGGMSAAVMSLRILDDKDEHMLMYYGVSPLRMKGYYTYRFTESVVISFIGIVVSCIGILQAIPIIYVLYTTLLCLLITVVVGSVAANKIQGMVFIKLSSLVVILPCIKLLGENKMDWIFNLVPWNYSYELIKTSSVNYISLAIYTLYVLGFIYFVLKNTKTE